MRLRWCHLHLFNGKRLPRFPCNSRFALDHLKANHSTCNDCSSNNKTACIAAAVPFSGTQQWLIHLCKCSHGQTEVLQPLREVDEASCMAALWTSCPSLSESCRSSLVICFCRTFNANRIIVCTFFSVIQEPARLSYWPKMPFSLDTVLSCSFKICELVGVSPQSVRSSTSWVYIILKKYKIEINAFKTSILRVLWEIHLLFQLSPCSPFFTTRGRSGARP